VTSSKSVGSLRRLHEFVPRNFNVPYATSDYQCFFFVVVSEKPTINFH
jgi:hypothetical protein